MKNEGQDYWVEDYPEKKGSNIRRAGEDFTKGDLVFPKGTVLSSEKLTVLANFGIAKITVMKKAKFVLATTGDEVRSPGTELSPGEIYNSSHTYIRSQLQAAGHELSCYHHLSDEFDECIQFVKEWLDSEGPSLLVTTGAVSMGEKDALPKVAQELGLKIHFHKSAVRPGKPVLFATEPRWCKAMDRRSRKCIVHC